MSDLLLYKPAGAPAGEQFFSITVYSFSEQFEFTIAVSLCKDNGVIDKEFFEIIIAAEKGLTQCLLQHQHHACTVY